MIYEVWSTNCNRVFTTATREAVERFAVDCAKVSDRYLDFDVLLADERDDLYGGGRLRDYLPAADTTTQEEGA